MKLIIFNPHCCIATSTGYRAAIRIAYLLGAQVATAGIGEQEYRLLEDKKNVSVEVKIKYLLKCYPPGDLKEKTAEFGKLLRGANTAKNKTQPQIIAMAKLKIMQEAMFIDYISFRYKTMDPDRGLTAMKEFIHPEKFHFYNLPCDINLIENKNCISKVQLLLLQVPDAEGQRAMFFIDRYKVGGPVDFPISLPHPKSAGDSNLAYGQTSYIFPKLDAMSANEIFQSRNELEELTREFREKLEQYIDICFESPNTNAGLDFFRKNLNEFLIAQGDVAIQTPILKSVSARTRKKSQFNIIIGQAPIQQIWQHYLEINAINDQEYNELLQIKKEQYPKYEGKWPVIFLDQLLDDLNTLPDPNHFMQSARKSIAVD